MAARALDIWGRLKRSFQRDGFKPTLERVLGVFLDRLSLLRAEKRAARRRLRDAESEFDERYRVSTLSPARAAATDVIGIRANHGVRYQGVDPRFDLVGALSAYGADPGSFVFVDIGAGMGRALLMAAELPFRLVIGVEYSSELIAKARANLEACNLDRGRLSAIELVHGDAVQYELPASPLVLFLYNPFDCTAMADFIEHVRRSYHSVPRRLFVIYINPQCAVLWDRADFISRVGTRQGAALYDTTPVGLETSNG